jgi:hypothetical protein
VGNGTLPRGWGNVSTAWPSFTDFPTDRECCLGNRVTLVGLIIAIRPVEPACHNRTFALHQKSRYSINSSAVTGSLSGTVSPILHGLEVDRKFERGRLRYWELRRFGSLENPSSIDVGLAIGIGEACRLANQAAGSDIVTDVVRYAQVLLG